MARLLPKIIKNALTGTVLVLLVFQPLIAFADTPIPGDTTDARNLPAAQNPNSGFGNLNPSLSPANANPVNPAPPAKDTSGGVDCSIFSATGLALCISDAVYVFTVGIGSGFAYVAAYFFDFAVSLSLNSAAYALTFVSTGWATARDIANMAFLFILIYIAFIIMFQADTSGTKDMLAMVILVALLVNFSFFFTRLVIDAGNILSIQFYNAIQASPISQTSGAAGAAATATSYLGQSGNTKDLTGSIMGMLNLQGLFNNTSFQAFTNGQSGLSGFLTTLIATSFLYIAAGIMLWLLTIAFFTNGIKFLFRIVVLWFLIIASPLAFVARAVPNFRGYYDRWQKELISHAFYPAVFMFIFLILTNFAQQLGPNSSQSLIQGIFGGVQPGNTVGGSYIATIGVAIANVGIRLGFVIIVLYIGFEAAKQVSVMGANIAEKGGNWVGGAYKGAFKYSAGYGAGALWRNTGGRAAAGASNAIAGSQWANRTGTLGGLLGYRLRRNVTEPLANTSLGTVASSFRERESFLGTREREMNTNIRDRENLEATERVVARRGAAPQTPQEHADENRVRRLNGRELETLSADQLTSLAHLLTAGQIQTIDRSNHFDDAARERISAAWNARGQRNNPLNGQFGSDDAAINRADRLIQEVNTLQTTMGRMANNIASGTRVTGTLIRDAIREVHQQVVDPATARVTALQSYHTQAVADEARARQAGNLALAAQHMNEALAHQQEIAQRMTEIRNGNNLIQNYQNLDTARGNLVPEPSHHINRNAPAPNRGEFDAR